MTRRLLYTLILPFILILTAGCELLPSGGRAQGLAPDAGPSPTPVPTPIVPTKPTYEVKQGEVIKTVKFTGRVSPVLEKELFFRVDGRIRNLFVERNDIVTAGQVLADLEIDDLERELTSLLLELQQAEQELAEAEQLHADNLARARLNLAKARAELDKADNDRLKDLAEARVELRIKELELARLQSLNPNPNQIQAEADIAEARNEVRRAQQSYDQIAYADDIGSSGEAIALESATLALERAQAAYDLALQNIGAYSYDLDLMAQQTALAQLKIERLQEPAHADLELAVTEKQLELSILERGIDPIYASNVERAKLNVQKIEAAIADAQIVAPFDGELLSVNLDTGREVTAYNPVIVLADPDELEVSAELLSSQLQDMSEGLPVVARLSSRPGEELAGVVRRLPYPYGGGGRSQGNLEEEDKSTRITLETEPTEFGLDLGDLLQIEVILERKDDVMWLPPQAIRNFDGRRFVVIQDSEAQRRLDIDIGIESEDRVEIEEGLTLGQVVIGP